MASTNIKYLKENNLYEAHKHFMRLSEVFDYPEMKHGVVQDDDDPNDPMAGGDPNAMGGDPNAMGADPMAGGDPNAMGGDPNAMGGDPNAMGADPNAMGQPMPDASDPLGGEDPFADQRGDDQNAMGDDDGSTIDIDGLTKTQEKLYSKENEVGRDLATVDNRLIKLMDTIRGLQDALEMNNNKLETLKAEFEKRNPTQTEKLDIRGAVDSYPFNVRPDEFWKKKMMEKPNYEIYGDNDKSTEDQYAITVDDINDLPSDIEKSFSIDDDYIQTLDKLFKL